MIFLIIVIILIFGFSNTVDFVFDTIGCFFEILFIVFFIGIIISLF